MKEVRKSYLGAAIGSAAAKKSGRYSPHTASINR